jgi:hypothetical protein
MVSWWWVIPALVAFVSALFVLNGLVSLFRGKPFSGVFKMIFGGVFLWASLAVTLLALNVQTYARLTYERPVATIQLSQLAPQYFEVTVIQPPATEGEPGPRRQSIRSMATTGASRPRC